MLISKKYMTFTYIGKTKYICTKIQQHNSGIRLVETEPFNLWTYALLVYICGFESNNYMLYYIEIVWKERVYILGDNGVHDIKPWAGRGYQVISELDEDNFGVKSTYLTLVFLF